MSYKHKYNCRNYNKIIKGEANNSPRNMDVSISTLLRVQNDAKTRIQLWKINQNMSNMPYMPHMTSNEVNNFLEMEGGKLLFVESTSNICLNDKIIVKEREYIGNFSLQGQYFKRLCDR